MRRRRNGGGDPESLSFRPCDTTRIALLLMSLAVFQLMVWSVPPFLLNGMFANDLVCGCLRWDYLPLTGIGKKIHGRRV